MRLKKYLAAISKNIFTNKTMALMRNRQISKEQFKFFIVQRISIANNFERLLSAGINKADTFGDKNLASVLNNNLNDERGKDAEGNINLKLVHRRWRENFLLSLNITDEIRMATPLLPETMQHSKAMLKIENEGDVFLVSGALLALELIIPVEYRNVRESRDHLFPEIFVSNLNDSPLQQQQKFQASLYINDHIAHDANCHYPELLNALLAYENDEEKTIKIKEGINLIKSCREIFYAGIEKNWQHINK